MSTINCAYCWGEKGKWFLRELEVSLNRTKPVVHPSLEIQTDHYKVLFKWSITLQYPNKKGRVHVRHCDNLDFKCDSLTGKPVMLANVSYQNKPEAQLPEVCKTVVSAWADTDDSTWVTKMLCQAGPHYRFHHFFQLLFSLTELTRSSFGCSSQLVFIPKSLSNCLGT